MNKKMSKRRRDIKSKLMAAICMLLVSSIMMVSTTYAWFTLSTAPEVTGIQTAVGANGNLEMALLPKDGQTSSITTNVGDSVKEIELKNVTWGNLVDLSNKTVYGLDKITLYPAELNASTKDDAGNPLSLADILLKTPSYGADGRISELNPNTVTGYFDSTSESFSPNNEYGVRAVGTASGMTPRQLSFRNAKSTANTARAQAVKLAGQSLNTNGSALANIAIAYGTQGTDAKFGEADVASLRAIINDLNGKGGVLDQIETAYMQYILAYAASAASGDADTVWSAVSGEVNKEGATLTSVITMLTNNSVELPDFIEDGIDAYNGMVTTVGQADTELQALEAELAADPDAKFEWADIRTAMEPLANPEKMKINGILASDVKNKMSELVSSVTANGGLKVILESGAGVYADIADQAGDYNASVTIEEVTYGGVTLNNMTARMETDSGLTPNNYLVAVGTTVGGLSAPSAGDNVTMPITDMYGYVIDLAFRTNAAESDLLLQVEAADRIYGKDNTNEETMGKGSYMTFAATTPDFSDDQVKALMDGIRIVFYDATNTERTVVATAKLDANAATLETDGWKAPIYLYKVTAGGAEEYVTATYEADSGKTYYTATTTPTTTYTAAADVTAENFADKITGVIYVKNGESYEQVQTGATFDADTTYYVSQTVDTTTYSEYTGSAAPAEGTQLYVKTVTAAGENRTGNKIMALTQNQAHALSVLVYLDGNKIGNDDVATTAATSITGTMNLQFASSATLVPMEYADLHIPGASTGTDDDATTYTVTINGNESTAAIAGQDYTIAVPEGHTLTKVEVGDTDITASVTGNVIPAASVTGNIVITTTGA